MIESTPSSPELSLRKLGFTFNSILLAAETDPLSSQPPEDYKKESFCHNLYQGFFPWDAPINFDSHDTQGFFWIADYLWREDNRVNEVWKAFKTTHASLEAHLSDLSDHLNKYENYLKDRFKDCHLNNSDIIETSNYILSFYNFCGPFLEMAKAQRYARITALFKQNIFCKNCFRHLDKLKSYYDEINLRARIVKPIPYQTIGQLSMRTRKSGEKEEESIWKKKLQQDSEWINFIERCANAGMEADELHLGLKAILQHFHNNHRESCDVRENRSPNLASLEDDIMQTKEALDQIYARPLPPILTQVSKSHLAWRSALREGSILKTTIIGEHPSLRDSYVMKIYEFTLGEPVGRKVDNVVDNYIFFKIASCSLTQRPFKLGEETLEDFFEETDDSQRVPQSDLAKRNLIAISYNEAMMGIKAIQHPNFLGYPCYPFIDAKGRFALVEKLGSPLGGETWKDKVDKSQENLEYYQSIIATFIQACLEKNLMPYPLNKNYLMQADPDDFPEVDSSDPKFWLKSVKPFQAMPFDLPLIEAFIYEASFKDKEIFRAIMSQIDFRNHKPASIYRDAILSTFDEHPFSIKERVESDLNVSDEAVIAYAEKLRTEIKALHYQICEQLSFEGFSLTNEDKKFIKDLLLKKYDQSGAISFLWPDLSTQIKDEYCQTQSPSKRN